MGQKLHNWTNAAQLDPFEPTSVKFEYNTKLFVHENAPEKVVCEMVATLSRGRWINKCTVKTMPSFIRLHFNITHNKGLSD